jgi:hypothetical protein
VAHNLKPGKCKPWKPARVDFVQVLGQNLQQLNRLLVHVDIAWLTNVRHDIQIHAEEWFLVERRSLFRVLLKHNRL